jgi:hypothetical protein
MKQIYSLLATALIATSAYAAGNGAEASFRKGGKFITPREHLSSSKAKTVAKAITKDQLTGEIVYTAPEGTTKYYSGASHSYYHIFSMTEEDVTGMTSEITFTADGKAYWKNPLSNAPFDTYIVGDVSGNKITFQFPQHLYDDTTYADWGLTYEFYTAVFEETTDEDGETDYDTVDNQTMTFTIADDGTITQDGNYILGLGDYDDWDEIFYFDGYADKNIVLTPFNDTKVVAPENVTFDYWVIDEDYNDNGKWLVQVGFDGDDVYVKGLSTDDKEMTFKGKVNGDKITVANGQYVGAIYYRYNYTQAGTVEYQYSEDYGREVGYVKDSAEDYVFNYDASARRMTSTGENSALLFSEGKNSGSYQAVTVNPTIYAQGEITTYEPEAALITGVEDDWDYYEQIGLRFENVLANVDGQLLPEENFGYEIYVDDQLFTFVAGDPYIQLTENLTEVPYTFSDDYDLMYEPGTNYHYIYFYFKTMTKLGVRMVYNAPDGKKYYSRMSSIDVSLDSVNGIDVDKYVVSEEYYDLSGRRIAGSDNGFAIKRIKYNDGSVSVVKVVR